jgi:hypothetical protein
MVLDKSGSMGESWQVLQDIAFNIGSDAEKGKIFSNFVCITYNSSCKYY